MNKTARWSLLVACLLIGGIVGSYVGGPLLRGQGTPPPAFPKELTSFRTVVKNVLPAVVSIEAKAKPVVKTKQATPRIRPRAEDMQIPEEFRRFFEEFDRLPRDLQNQEPRVGFGSGFIVDAKGVVLTNNHVVDGADQVEIQLADGRKFISKDIKTDPKTDLAIVRIETKEALPYLEMGDSDAMEIGDRVLAVGAPFGLTGTVTAGIISAKGRNGLNMNMYEDFVQTDAAINPGNSGGPLVNLEGKVVGINSAIKSRSGGFQGIGLAVASNLAKNVMTQLLKDGVVRRGYLGIQIKDLDLDVAERLGVKGKNGVVVSHVQEGAPAAKGGVKDGDVIVGLGGKSIKDGHELQRIVAALPLGKPADLMVVRDGKTLTLSVSVEEQPKDFGNARVPVRPTPKRDPSTMSLDKIGLEITDLTPEMADELGFAKDAKGAVVTQVEPGSAAAAAGLRRGALIVKVDKVPVASATAARDAVEKAALDKGVLFQVQTPQGGTSYLVLKAETASK